MIRGHLGYHSQRREERDGTASREATPQSLLHRRAATGLSQCELSDPQASPRRTEMPKEGPLPGKGTRRPVGANWIMERLIGSRKDFVIRLVKTVNASSDNAWQFACERLRAEATAVKQYKLPEGWKWELLGNISKKLHSSNLTRRFRRSFPKPSGGTCRLEDC